MDYNKEGAVTASTSASTTAAEEEVFDAHVSLVAIE